jgi:hypothetical protein
MTTAQHLPSHAGPATRTQGQARPAKQRPPFADAAQIGVDPALVQHTIESMRGTARTRLSWLWTYYRNPLRIGTVGPRPYRLGQERGLPHRLTQPPPDDDRGQERELVIENDIAWRIGAMVDFLFGKPVRVRSQAEDPAVRRRVERAVDEVWQRSGGAATLQRAAVLGHVFGHVDLAVRRVGGAGGGEGTGGGGGAGGVFIEVLDPRCACAVTPDALAAMTAGPAPAGAVADAASGTIYVIHTPVVGSSVWLHAALGPGEQSVTEVLTATHRQVYADRGQGPELVHQERNAVSPGELPIAHAPNGVSPGAGAVWLAGAGAEAGAGLSDVEPLIPLQDELNTRLSDRAYRVTLQSFKMLLVKGLSGFDKAPVGPGMVWSTENPDASIEPFGGDGASPSEDRHIDEVREALDKLSGVPPLATGVVRAKVGNLSSENALRLTLQGLLARTRRKRVTYGAAVLHASGLALAALDEAGVLKTGASERALTLEWPDELIGDGLDSVREAQAKAELGVPRTRLIEELGYGTAG